MAEILSASTSVEAGNADTSGAGSTRPRRSGGARRFSWTWLGLVPFFGFVLLVFLVPIGFILFDAFRKTTQGVAHRNPVTQQFEHTSTTTFTGSNVSQSLQGVYRTSLYTSVKLSIIVAVIAAV